MDNEIKTLIDTTYQESMDGKRASREAILKLLSLPTMSEEVLYMRKLANDMTNELFGNKVVIGTALGMDWYPCKGNCSFCAFGEKWGLVKEPVEFSVDETVSIISKLVARGFKSYTLRTTEFYSVDKMCMMGEAIRANVKGDYSLNANLGELTYKEAERLYDAGFNGAYHAVRLREGVDTPFDPAVRLQTIKNIRRSRLNWSSSIDPLGEEHTNEEIVDMIEFLEQFDPKSMGVMRRMCVPGTPKGKYKDVSDDRMAQVVAVLRLMRSDWRVSGAQVSRQVLMSGSRSFTVEIGASPRRDGFRTEEWKIMDHNAAIDFVRECGCEPAFGTKI